MKINEVIKIRKLFNPEWQDSNKTLEVEKWKLARIDKINDRFITVTYITKSGKDLYKESFSIGELIDNRFMISAFDGTKWGVIEKSKFIKFRL